MTDRELIRLANLWSNRALITTYYGANIYLGADFPDSIDDATCLAQQLYCEQILSPPIDKEK